MKFVQASTCIVEYKQNMSKDSEDICESSFRPLKWTNIKMPRHNFV